MRRVSRIKKSTNDTVFYFINDLLLLIAFVVVAYPVIYIVSASFSSSQAVASGRVVLFPVDISLAAYKAVFQHEGIVLGYANTIYYTVVGTFINIIFTIMAAYPLSRPKLPFRKIFIALFTFTMIFNGGLIPTYMLNNNLGLMNTRWVMVLPVALNIFNLMIAKTFFEGNIPEELYEASQIDGCNYFKFIWHVVMPLSKAIIAVLALYYAVVHWNAYFNAFLYLTDESKFPLQIFLREILVLNKFSVDNMVNPEDLIAKQGMAELLKYALIIVSSVPLMVAYPFIAKYFAKGTLSGAVKG